MSGTLRRSSAWQFLQTLFGTGSELVLLLVLAAWQSRDAFSQWVVAASACKVAFLLVEPRIHEFLTPRLARMLDRNSTGVWTWTRWAVVVELACNLAGLVICLVVLPLMPVIGPQAGRALLAAVALYTLANTLAKFSALAVLRCIGQVRVAAQFAIAAAAVKLATLAVAMAGGWSLPLLFALAGSLVVLTSGAQIAYALVLLRRRSGPIRIPAARPLRAVHRRGMLHALSSNYGTGFIEMLHRELDVQIAIWLAGPAEAARYRLAKTMASVILEALNPVVLVLLPEFSRRLHGGAPGELAAFVRRVRRGLGLLGAAATAVVLAASWVYLHHFAVAQEGAWPAVALLALAMALAAPWLWCQAMLVAQGRPAAYLRCSAIGASCAVAAAVATVGLFGAPASAAAFGLGLMVTTFGAAAAARH